MSDEEPAGPTKEQICLVEIEELCRKNAKWSRLAGIILRKIAEMKASNSVKAKVKFGKLPKKRRGGG
jgi:hypothetical protein